MEATIETTAGKVRGERRGATIAFLGIPFAAPPVGKLRFAPPEPVAPWAGVRDALAYAPSPPQRIPGMPEGSPDPIGTSEDCLYLNVWTPSTKGGLPVLAYLHGGGFLFGAGAIPNPEKATLLAREDAVVVTLNYRVGVLGGFVNLSEARGLDFTPNVGLADQLAALRWVRDNVAAFGGDPGRVMLFGMSAGAMSVATLLGMPASRGLFRRAIAQSGGASSSVPKGLSLEIGDRFLAHVGRDASKLATMTPDELVAASNGFYEACSPHGPAAAFRTSGLGHDARWIMPFAPIIDGRLVPEDPIAAIAKGSARDVALVVGSTLNESNLFIMSDPGLMALDESTIRERLANRIPIAGKPDPKFIDRLVAAYREAGRIDPALGAWTALAAIESDRSFNVPAVRLADAQAKVRPDTRSYLWTRPCSMPALAACHAVDAPIVLGLFEEPTMAVFVGEESSARRLSEVVQASWIAFAATGDPSTAATGTWEPFGTDRRTMIIDDPMKMATDPFADVLPLWSAIL